MSNLALKSWPDRTRRGPSIPHTISASFGWVDRDNKKQKRVAARFDLGRGFLASFRRLRSSPLLKCLSPAVPDNAVLAGLARPSSRPLPPSHSPSRSSSPNPLHTPFEMPSTAQLPKERVRIAIGLSGSLPRLVVRDVDLLTFVASVLSRSRTQSVSQIEEAPSPTSSVSASRRVTS